LRLRFEVQDWVHTECNGVHLGGASGEKARGFVLSGAGLLAAMNVIHEAR
jgi:hypothetical protein